MIITWRGFVEINYWIIINNLYLYQQSGIPDQQERLRVKTLKMCEVWIDFCFWYICDICQYDTHFINIQLPHYLKSFWKLYGIIYLHSAFTNARILVSREAIIFLIHQITELASSTRAVVFLPLKKYLHSRTSEKIYSYSTFLTGFSKNKCRKNLV